MASDTVELIRAIEAFNVPPEEDETETVHRLYRLLDGAEKLPRFDTAGEALFRLLERHADRDLGNPGPVVHALETIGAYSTLLRESLLRRPTYYTLWMVNRILNTALSASDRAAWLSELVAARHHPRADAAVIESAAQFLEYQGAQ